ncbi:MAG: hypothetical protein LUJ25_03330, partial [Firmicutes bacterium]|nr:hypothetical protein [Bacillota bacterium]
VSVMLGEKDSEQEVDFSVIANEVTADQGGLGGEYQIPSGVTIEKDGNIVLAPSANFVEMSAPVYLALTEDKGEPVYIEYERGKKASLILEEGQKGEYGYYRCVELSNKGDDNCYLLIKDGKASFVAKEKASKIAYKGGNLIVDGEQTLTKGIQFSHAYLNADEVDACEIPLLNTISGDYVLLSVQKNGASYFVKDASGNVTTNYTEAELWKVSKSSGVNGRYVYTFQSRQDNTEYLTIDGTTQFAASDYTGGFALVGVDRQNEGGVVVNTANTALEFAAVNTNAGLAGLYTSKLEAYTAQWLVHRYGGSFLLNVVDKYKDIDDKTIWGNEFDSEDLVPVVAYIGPAGMTLVEVALDNNIWGADGKDAFLLKKKGTDLYIVLKSIRMMYGATLQTAL